MNGKAYCWGNGRLGQIGNGSWTETHTSVQVTFP